MISVSLVFLNPIVRETSAWTSPRCIDGMLAMSSAFPFTCQATTRLAIARNLHRDFVSHNRRLTSIIEAAEGTTPAPSPERVAADGQSLTAVLKAIQRLPEPQREALVLSVDQDLHYDQSSCPARPGRIPRTH